MLLEKSRQWFHSTKEAVSFIVDDLGFKPLPKYKGKIPKLTCKNSLEFMGKDQAAIVTMMPASGMVLVKFTKPM